MSGSKGVASLGGAGKYVGLGFQFVASILLFLWIGKWLDAKVGTDGPFVLLGVFIGAGAAFYSMYRGLMADQRREEEAEARRRAAAAAKQGGEER
ncbi:MAG: AtpZ/AtpI family protein [Gemmatimonadaceae bacterium]|nr:AtpZ/AtpI family protein [Gemmatimonadaceae bacterium]